MPCALIAGCGYVGRVAGQIFARRGWDVEGWTGTTESADALAGEAFAVHCLDVTRRDAVLAACARRFDIVVQSVSSRGGGLEEYRRIYLGGANNLLEAFPTARLIFTSSTGVYAQGDGEWVDEESVAAPQRETARVLREAENLVLAHTGVVARLSGIYGPGRSALVRKIMDGRATIRPGAPRFLNQIHRDDAAAALVFLAEQYRQQAAVPALFNVTDNTPLLEGECYEFLAAELQCPLPPTAEPSAPRKRGDTNKRVSNCKLRKLGWAPQYPDFFAGFRESLWPALARHGG